MTIKKPEVFFALVGATGTDLGRLSKIVSEEIGLYGYQTKTIRLSRIISRISGLTTDIDGNKLDPIRERHRDCEIESQMDHGDALRTTLRAKDPLACVSVVSIRALREESTKAERAELTINNASVFSVPNQAYVIQSLKHPDEVRTLRDIYNDSLVVIGAYTPTEARIDELAEQIATSRGDHDRLRWRPRAEELINRDQGIHSKNTTQNVRDTFSLADLFVDLTRVSDAQNAVKRYLEAYFDYRFHTPTPDEFCMYHARASALRSSSLGRQVGAAVATKTGDIVSVGSNEVPKFGGGQYWYGDNPDDRDFHGGHDTGVLQRRILLTDTLRRLKSGGIIENTFAERKLDELSKKLVSDNPPPWFKDAQIRGVTEYGREVHAEMAALTDAAKRGASVDGHDLFTTTFPCHNCAKHIVASGIRRVVYIEPYAKSRASQFYPDAIRVDESGIDSHVSFEPFLGIAPRRYQVLFESDRRKDDDGDIIGWSSREAIPRMSRPPTTYLIKELFYASKIEKDFDSEKLKIK